ncbi:MAG: 3-keto-5-aminohexanoate cleavage protein [Pseudomonadota bacterium]
MSLSDKLIINAALTGMVPVKKNNPHVPITEDEIVSTACRVRDAGAAIVHLHARDKQERPSYDFETYTAIVNRIRECRPDLIVCVSLSGRTIQDLDTRAAPLMSRPDMASLTLGSMNFPKQANVNSPPAICQLAARIYEAGAIPELEAFDTGFINYARDLISKKVLRPPFYFNLILGFPGAAAMDLITLGHMVSLLPERSTWSVAGIGRYQLPANTIAIAAGGHVRIGLEDNLFYDSAGRIPADNVGLVERIVRLGREMGRDPATPDEARTVIGLPRI